MIMIDRLLINNFKRNNSGKRTEIKNLFDYCIEKGIDANIVPLYDGYKICFPNGGSFVQHSYSWGGNCGYVEPEIGCSRDKTAVTSNEARHLVRYYKDRLNTKGGNTDA